MLSASVRQIFIADSCKHNCHTFKNAHDTTSPHLCGHIYKNRQWIPPRSITIQWADNPGLWPKPNTVEVRLRRILTDLSLRTRQAYDPRAVQSYLFSAGLSSTKLQSIYFAKQSVYNIFYDRLEFSKSPPIRLFQHIQDKKQRPQQSPDCHSRFSAHKTTLPPIQRKCTFTL